MIENYALNIQVISKEAISRVKNVLKLREIKAILDDVGRIDNQINKLGWGTDPCTFEDADAHTWDGYITTVRRFNLVPTADKLG